MSLIVPPFQFAYCTDSLSGTTPTNTPGTSVTAGASNADGSAVGILSALAHDAERLVIGVAGFSGSTIPGNTLLTVLIDPAGGTSWATFIEYLLVGGSRPVGSAQPHPFWYDFPVWIPAGATVGVQARTAHTVDITTGRVVMQAYGGPSRPDAWICGQKVETVGATAASSRGTDITAGNSGTFGSWTSVGSVTTARYQAVVMGVQGTDGAAANERFHTEFGYSSVKLPGTPLFHHMNDVSETCMPGSGYGKFYHCDLVAGTQLQARMTANASSPETQNVAMYGVY